MVAALIFLAFLTYGLHARGPSPARMLELSSQGLVSQLYASQKSLFACGERGHIFQFSPSMKPEDVKQIQTPARQYLTAITGDLGQRLWAVGHDSIILFSPDAGRSWEVQHFKPEWEKPLFDVVFVGTDEVVAVGAYGLYLHSSDGGKQWRKVMVNEEEPHFFDADLLTSQQIYLAGEFGTVMRCPPSGKNPQRFETEIEGSLFGIEVMGDKQWFGFGLRGRIYHYKEGKTQLIPTNSKASIFGSLSHDSGITFFGADGFLLHYTSGKTITRSIKDRVIITDAAASGSNLILSTTEGFRVLPW